VNAEERRTALVRLSTSADLAGFRPQPGADQLVDAYLDHADDCLDIVRARTHWRVTLEFSYQAASLAADAILAAMGYRTAAVERAHLGRVQVALEACNVCGIDVADAGRRLEGQAIGLRNRVHSRSPPLCASRSTRWSSPPPISRFSSRRSPRLRGAYRVAPSPVAGAPSASRPRRTRSPSRPPVELPADHAGAAAEAAEPIPRRASFPLFISSP
jgi:hypothetical protein